eukprot:1538748-Pleurochrysis_carterae.AAC.1
MSLRTPRALPSVCFAPPSFLRAARTRSFQGALASALINRLHRLFHACTLPACFARALNPPVSRLHFPRLLRACTLPACFARALYPP